MTDVSRDDTTDALLELSMATSEAPTLEELATVVTRTAGRLVGAANAALGVVARRDAALRIFQGPAATIGYSTIRLVGLDEPTPLTDAVRTGRAILIDSSDEFIARYPNVARRISPGEVTAMATYPLELDGEILGSCLFRFSDGPGFTETRLQLMERMPPLLVRGIARIQARAELIAYARRLEQSNRDLDNFAAVVAHDLSAPVRRIGSFLQLLVREISPLGDTAARYADIIGKQVQHLDALLRDTLAYAQVVAPTDTRQVTALSSILTDVLGPLQPTIERLGATVTIGDLPLLDIEVTLIQQVFQDLFDNALKYRRDDRPPTIEVTCDPQPPQDGGDTRTWWKISVADNGIGIDPERTGEVFAMFARLDVSKDRPGTGVGLAFVKRVIERHDGEIGIAPGIDGGTTFWFTLPGPAEPDVI